MNPATASCAGRASARTATSAVHPAVGSVRNRDARSPTTDRFPERTTNGDGADEHRDVPQGLHPACCGDRRRGHAGGRHRDAVDQARRQCRPHPDRLRAAGSGPGRPSGPAPGLLVLDRHPRRGDEAGQRRVHPPQPRRHRSLPAPPRRRHRAGQQPRDPRAVRHGAARTPPRRPDLRPGRSRGVHHRRGRSHRQARRRAGRHRRHADQLRGRADSLGNVADLRGGVLVRRHRRLPEGPRLRLRRRPARRRRQPGPETDHGVGPVRARGGRGRSPPRRHLPHRGRRLPHRSALPMAATPGLPRGPWCAAPARADRRRAGRHEGRRRGGQARSRPLAGHGGRHHLQHHVGAGARPRRPHHTDPPAARRGRHHPLPEAGGSMVGRRRRLRRLQLLPGERQPRCGEGARRTGLVLQPPPVDADVEADLRPQPHPRRRRTVRRPGQHQPLPLRRSDPRGGRPGHPAPRRRPPTAVRPSPWRATTSPTPPATSSSPVRCTPPTPGSSSTTSRSPATCSRSPVRGAASGERRAVEPARSGTAR